MNVGMLYECFKLLQLSLPILKNDRCVSCIDKGLIFSDVTHGCFSLNSVCSKESLGMYDVVSSGSCDVSKIVMKDI